MSHRKFVFVTGASGFAGRHLLRHLRGCGVRARALVRNPEKIADLAWDGLEIARGAVETPGVYKGLLDGGVDAVVHMASVYREKNPAVFQAVHVEGTRALLEEMKAARVGKLVFISTNAAGDEKWGDYGVTKREAEKLIEASPLNWTILRPTILYGPNDDKNLQFLYKLAKISPVLPTLARGLAPLQPAHVFDLLRAIDAALNNPEAGGKTYTIAGPDPVPMWDLWNEIRRAMGKRRILFPIPVAALRLLVWAASKMSKNPGASSDKVDNFLKGKAYDLAPARRDLGFDPMPWHEGARSIVRPEEWPTP